MKKYFCLSILLAIPLLTNCNNAEKFLVNFDSNGGSFIPSQSILKNKCVDKPTDPQKIIDDFAYTFNGWKLNDKDYDFSSPVTQNLTLKASWSGEKPFPIVYHYVIFESNNETNIETKKIEHGKPVSSPDVPIKEGYTFDAWFLDSTFAGSAYDFDTPVTDDITLYAKYTKNKAFYDFKFEGADCTLVCEEQYEEGTVLNDLIIVPTKGYHLPEKINVVGPDSFDYNPSNGKLSLTVNSNVTVICNAIQDDPVAAYTITFVMNGATSAAIPSQTINDGDKVEEPNNPTKTGHSFKGWYIKEVFEDTNKFNFESEVHQDYILYACWEIDIYNISFYDGDTELKELNQIVKYNEKVQRPEAPIKNHYVFDNWYINKTYISTNVFNFENLMTGKGKDICIYAHYVEQEYRVTFNTNGGSIETGSEFVNIKYGHSIPIDSVPIVKQAGYDYLEVEWYDSPIGGRKFSFGENGTPVTGPTTLYAQWGDIKQYTVNFLDSNDNKVANSQTVKYNQRIVKPIIYECEAYSTIEFYKDKSFSNEFNFEDSITQDNITLNIYVKLIKKIFIVTFIGNGGTIEGESALEVNYGGTVSVDDVPTINRDGYKSSDVTWHLDPTEDTPFKFEEDEITSDVNLYAHWGNIKTYTVIFDGNGGKYGTDSKVTRNNVPFNTMPEIPNNPVRIDETGAKVYSFKGYDKNIVPAIGDAEIITYTAQWGETDNFRRITLISGEGKFIDSSIKKYILVENNSILNNALSFIVKPQFTETNDKIVYKFNKWIYEDGSDIGLDDTVDSDIVVKATYAKKTLEECTWNEVSRISNKGAEYARSYFGDVSNGTSIEKSIIVNGIDHKVRIIGYGFDVDSQGNSLGITFDFINLISDVNGYSLATYWQDTSNDDISNHDFLNSSVYRSLTNQGTSELNWFRYYGIDEDGTDETKGTTSKNKHFTSDTNYVGKSVYDMLPLDLRNELKVVKKSVNIKDSGGGWASTEFNDKLFLLSNEEIGNTLDGHEYERYDFYNTILSLLIERRTKTQVIGSDGARTEYLSGHDLDGACTVSKHCYAGYGGDGKNGIYWLRSPHITYNNMSYYIKDDGNIDFYLSAAYARGIAPAFCI